METPTRYLSRTITPEKARHDALRSLLEQARLKIQGYRWEQQYAERPDTVVRLQAWIEIERSFCREISDEPTGARIYAERAGEGDGR